MNPVATRLSEASVLMEGTPHSELVEMLRIGAEEIQRLQSLVDDGKEAVWGGRRFLFQTLKQPGNTPLAIVFNRVLEALGQTVEEDKAMYARFYPQPPVNRGARDGT